MQDTQATQAQQTGEVITAKPTPGPWHVEYVDGETYRIVDDKDMQELSRIATVHFHDDEEGETRANAHLLANADRLLEHLKTTLRMLEAAYIDLGMSRDNPRIQAARAAIAAAEGRTS